MSQANWNLSYLRNPIINLFQLWDIMSKLQDLLFRVRFLKTFDKMFLFQRDWLIFMEIIL